MCDAETKKIQTKEPSVLGGGILWRSKLQRTGVEISPGEPHAMGRSHSEEFVSLFLISKYLRTSFISDEVISVGFSSHVSIRRQFVSKVDRRLTYSLKHT